MPRPPDIRIARVHTQADLDYFSMQPLERAALGATYASGMAAHHAAQSPAFRPPPTPAWGGSRTPHGMQIAAEAVDYFHAQTGERKSWRAVQNLAMVAGGRCVISLGLAGVSEAYVRGGLLALPKVDQQSGSLQAVQNFHVPIFTLGALGAAAGLLMHTIGVARFHHDTSKINRKRAHIVATAATLGALLVAGGGAYYAYALVQKDAKAVWGTLPIRALGNGCVFFSIPASFTSSELTHGLTPVQNRILWRDLCFAGGGMFLMAWAQISSPTPPAPLWAREVTQCVGIVMTALGGALPRVEAMRAQATARRMASPLQQAGDDG